MNVTHFHDADLGRVIPGKFRHGAEATRDAARSVSVPGTGNAPWAWSQEQRYAPPRPTCLAAMARVVAWSPRASTLGRAVLKDDQLLPAVGFALRIDGPEGTGP